MTRLSFTPTRKPDAGSLIGVSYITEFMKCPRRWFYKYYQPATGDDGVTGTVGIEPIQKAPALLSGGIFHKALEVYYTSGVRDGEDTGERNLDMAVAALEKEWSAAGEEYRDETAAEEDREMLTSMLVEYHEHVGPGGLAPDYPRIMVMCDSEGHPLVEREFATPLGYQNYYMTSKVDLIISDAGYLKGMEHKTSVASYIGSRISSIHYDAQFTGEIYTLQCHFDEPMYGVKVNVIQKRRSPRSKYAICERDTCTRTQAQIEDFKQACVDTLMQIDQRVMEYEHWTVTKGIDKMQALAVWFPAQGTFNGECEAYRRPCDYFALCRQPERAHQLLGAFKPRTRPTEESMEEQ